MANHKEIGTIGCYYGSLIVKQVEDKFYWSIEDVSTDYWEEIPKYLYDALLKFDSEKA